MADDYPHRVIRVVSDPRGDFYQAQKILLPEGIDITDNFERIRQQLRAGIKPPEIEELDKQSPTIASFEVKQTTANTNSDHLQDQNDLNSTNSRS